MDLGNYDQPARITGRVARLSAGLPATQTAWRGTWLASGYQERPHGEVVDPGQFSMTTGLWKIHPHDGDLLEIRTTGRRVSSVERASDKLPIPLWEFPLPTIALLATEDASRRSVVGVEDLPVHLVRAILASQDPRFYKHHGLDLAGRTSSHLSRLIDQRPHSPPSITRQLARDMFSSPDRSWQRLAQETVITLLLEQRYSKAQILEAYLNGVDFGRDPDGATTGIVAAAHSWLGKDVAAVDLAEAALLAGAVGAPQAIDPREYPDRARSRRDLVLQRMEELGLVDPGAVIAARAQPIRTAPVGSVRRTAPWFIAELLEELQPRFNTNALHRDGLELHTTLDPILQVAARQAVDQGLAELRQAHPQWWSGEDGPEAALIALDPRDGAIRAMIGAASYDDKGHNLATEHLGIAGPAFKPIVLAAAISEMWPGLGPMSQVLDEPISVAGSGLLNFGNEDGAFLGRVSLRTATERARNPPFVRLGISVGPKRLLETARSLGVRSPLKPRLSLALGEQALTLLDLATAYSTIANGGLRPKPRVLEGVRSAQGTWLEHPMPKSDGAIDPRVASVVTTLLQGVVDRGTAHAVRTLGFQLPVAAITGLSATKSDDWMIGYTPDLTVAVWIGAGANRRLVAAKQDLAVPMWTRFMISAEPYLEGAGFRQPPGAEIAGSSSTQRRPELPQRRRLEDEDRQRRSEERRATQRMERGAL